VVANQAVDNAAVLEGIRAALAAADYVDDIVDKLEPTQLVQMGFLTLTAEVAGPNVLGKDETIQLFNETAGDPPTLTIVGNGFSASEVRPGVITLNTDPTAADIVGTDTSITDGVDVDVSAAVTPDIITEAKDVTQIDQDITNPSDDSDLYGDSPLTGMDGEDNLLGIGQDYLNPDNGRGEDTDGDASFYGDDPLTGAIDGEDIFNGEGVEQTHTNPDSGYDAIDESPTDNVGSNNTGEDSLHGSEPGYYTKDGLYTLYLNGATPESVMADPDDNDLYTEDRNSDSLTDRVDTDDTVVDGEDSGSFTDSDAGEDGFDIEAVEDGFAAFEWDESVVTLRSTGSKEADIINNFQVGGWVVVADGEDYVGDSIGLEGALLNSTVEGDVEWSAGAITFVEEPVYQYVYVNFGDQQGEPFLEWKYGSMTLDTSGFDLDKPITITAPNFNVYFRDTDGDPSQTFWTFTAGSLNSWNALAQDITSELNTYYGAGTVTYSVVDGDLVFRALPGYQFNSAGDSSLAVTGTSTETYLTAFDLSTDEFGLVFSANSTLDAAEIGSASDVAGLLSSLFDFDAVNGGTTDNGEINTTVFAVTAADNNKVTAIWAHTQSSSGDSTVDDFELSLLATVNTLGGEFRYENFANYSVMPG